MKFSKSNTLFTSLLLSLSLSFAAVAVVVDAFVVPTVSRTTGTTFLQSSSSSNGNGNEKAEDAVAEGEEELEEQQQAKERMQEMWKEEAGNPFSMKAAADQMKNLKAEDVDRMVQEMDSMNPLQKQALKAMGMDPNMMKQTLSMMRDNPQMVESAQKLMSNMTPEQLMEQSKMAQQRMATMTPEQLEQTNVAMNSIPQEQLDQAVGILSKEQEQQVLVDVDVDVDGDEDKDAETSSSTSTLAADPKVLDAMYQVAELMSDNGNNSNNGVTLAGFASLPVVQLLRGDREEDLSLKELKECWADGSLGATRVDRAGFARVWDQVQEYFEDEIVGEAKKEAKKQIMNTPMKSSSSSSATIVPPTTPASTPASSSSSSTVIGDNLSAEQLKEVNDKVKGMSDNDVNQVLSSMQDMDPVQEARLKSMGVDPKMMQKTAEMMKTNPMMRKAAQAMMNNMSPEQMVKMSQQAQQQMKNMSPEEIETAMNKAKDMANTNNDNNN